MTSAIRYAVNPRFSFSEVPRQPRLLVSAPADLGRSVRTGVINNPLSFRNKRRHTLDAALDVLHDYPRIPHYEVDCPEDIGTATRTLVDAGCEMLVVNGGDGTVQAVLTELFGGPPLDGLPLLAVIPGGTTNMVAADIGAMERTVPALQRLLSAARTGRLRGEAISRPIIRAETSVDAPPVFGLFFGTGAIYHGITLCRRYIATLGLRGELGPGLALGVFLAKLATGQGGALFPPMSLSGQLDGEAVRAGEYRAVLVSTVSRQFLGLRPFWGREPGPLKYTALSCAPRHFLRAVPAIMRGKPNRFVRPENGYMSRNAHEVELYIDCGFTLDGELYPSPPPGEPVILRSGYSAFFFRQREA